MTLFNSPRSVRQILTFPLSRRGQETWDMLGTLSGQQPDSKANAPAITCSLLLGLLTYAIKKLITKSDYNIYPLDTVTFSVFVFMFCEFVIFWCTVWTCDSFWLHSTPTIAIKVSLELSLLNIFAFYYLYSLPFQLASLYVFLFLMCTSLTNIQETLGLMVLSFLIPQFNIHQPQMTLRWYSYFFNCMHENVYIENNISKLFCFLRGGLHCSQVRTPVDVSHVSMNLRSHVQFNTLVVLVVGSPGEGIIAPPLPPPTCISETVAIY